MENNKLIDFHFQSPLQAIAHQPWWNIERETKNSLWSNNICSIVITNYNKYIIKTLETNYYEVVEFYSLVMVSANHNQREHSKKHEYKHFTNYFLKNFAMVGVDHNQESLRASMNISVHKLLMQ
jgi:glycogen debranching enzyme